MERCLGPVRATYLVPCSSRTLAAACITSGRSQALYKRTQKGILPARCVAQVTEQTVVHSSSVESKGEGLRQLSLTVGAKLIPHPNKESYGGEDAYFVSNIGGGALGVADGVGGWAESGINPAEYSRTFMAFACAFLEGRVPAPAAPGSDAPAAAAETDDPQSRHPQRALEVAHNCTRLPGSSTACVLRLDRAGARIEAANLGDSGFALVRDGEMVFRTPSLQHFFDCPFQFGSFPDYTNATDFAADANVFELPVQLGDILVAGTDGLWDNVFENEVLEVLAEQAGQPDQAAASLAMLARRHAEDPAYNSPYMAEARKQGFDLPMWEKVLKMKVQDGKLELGKPEGGKLDDITVLVAYVTEEEVPPPPAEELPAEPEAQQSSEQ